MTDLKQGIESREMKKDGSLVWVLGAGTSGAAAARLLSAHGKRVHVLDERVEAAEALERSVGGGGFEGEEPEAAVVSPGLSAETVLRREVEARGIRVVSELDAALPYLRSRLMMGVTGSKGKSSLVKLLADACVSVGMRSVPCGNYGTALAEVALREPTVEVPVVECSSYQLETTREFHPRVGIFLNLSPDHLTRHGSMEAYCDAKMRLFQNMTPEDLVLLPNGRKPYDLFERFVELGYRGHVAFFGNEPDAHWRWVPGEVWNANGVRIPMAGSYFDNPVLGPAAAAASAALLYAGLSPSDISRALVGFEPLPHRRQWVRTVRGVAYVNDSKATSLTALLAGVSMISGPVRLIAGGRLKETNVEIGKELMTAGVQKGYLIGECAEKLAAAWSREIPVQICGTLDAAVALAAAESSEGETVLLSPGTASFDQFRSFEDRGNRFAQLVNDLS